MAPSQVGAGGTAAIGCHRGIALASANRCLAPSAAGSGALGGISAEPSERMGSFGRAGGRDRTARHQRFGAVLRGTCEVAAGAEENHGRGHRRTGRKGGGGSAPIFQGQIREGASFRPP